MYVWLGGSFVVIKKLTSIVWNVQKSLLMAFENEQIVPIPILFLMNQILNKINYELQNDYQILLEMWCFYTFICRKSTATELK